MATENKNGKKILLICPTSRNALLFRKGVILALQARGYDVSVAAFNEECKTQLEELGVAYYPIIGSTRGLNPYRLLQLKKQYAYVIQKVQPDTVFTFGLKPNAYGIIAAKNAGVKNIYAMIEGAGDPFVFRSLKWRIIRFVVCKLYKRAFRYAKKVFFVNSDDPKMFVSLGVLKQEQCAQADGYGVGIDIDRFAYVPLKNKRTFLMVARMLKAKGVFAYCEAAKRVKAQYPDAEFLYVGGEDELTTADIQPYVQSGVINYIGRVDDLRPYYAECTVHVLPTYREGLPIANAEAAATGRAIITTDAVGARDTVVDGYNGFKITIDDVDVLSEKIVYFIENPDEAEKMGENSRSLAVERFDGRKIVESTVAIIDEA